MVTSKLVEALRGVIDEANQGQCRYVRAWLSPNDDLTGRERYILHVQAAHELPSRFGEIVNLTEKLRAVLDPELLRLISRITLYNDDEPTPLWANDLIVIEEGAGSLC
jgi:hypothetical protein